MPQEETDLRHRIRAIIDEYYCADYDWEGGEVYALTDELIDDIMTTANLVWTGDKIVFKEDKDAKSS